MSLASSYSPPSLQIALPALFSLYLLLLQLPPSYQLSSSALAYLPTHPSLIIALIGTILILPVTASLLNLYLLLELTAFSLLALLRHPTSSEYSLEASLKYYLLTASSSIAFLLAMILLIGLTGTTLYTSLILLAYSNLAISGASPITIGIILLLTIKLALLPNPLWHTEVYEGVSTTAIYLLALPAKLPYLYLLLNLASLQSTPLVPAITIVTSIGTMLILILIIPALYS